MIYCWVRFQNLLLSNGVILLENFWSMILKV
ncbi:hypothetical protein Golob_019590 [Gossypium lobatum]|uniref:Uncharacterized protein n=1 Tax=Gossypium lobatum TaxID=34289 RepID=A0A7J8L818_9ROSI|nr:hypothetical protein [Gossypium lobatum]